MRIYTGRVRCAWRPELDEASLRCDEVMRRGASAVLIIAAVTSSVEADPSLSVEGTEFVVVADGKTHRGLELVGATLRIGVRGALMDVTLAAAEIDGSAVGGPVFLYRFVTKDDAGYETDLCTPDAKRKSLGFPVSDGRGGFQLACTSSAVGKCVRWGYRPWDEVLNGPPLRALHAACVHMTRADYGGDDHATTIEGKAVYFCDRFGVRACAKKPPLTFEAAWGVAGATCVARPRVPKNVSLDELRRQYPKLRSRLGSRACTAQSAFKDPDALLINRSALN